MPRTLRPYRYLKVREEDRENPHLVRERVRCGKTLVWQPRNYRMPQPSGSACRARAVTKAVLRSFGVKP